MSPTFAKKFDRSKLAKFKKFIPRTYWVMEAFAKKGKIRWPRRIEAMTDREVTRWKKEGKGHGLYYTDTETVKLNASMDWFHLYLNFIHENLHHAIPEASDRKINEELIPEIVYQVTGIQISHYDGNVVHASFPSGA